MSCAVRHCRSIWSPKCDIRFHSFPKNPIRRKLWLSIMPLKRKFYENAKICSLHFKAKDYTNPENPERLITTACPFYTLQDCCCDATKPCNSILPDKTNQNPDVNFVETMESEQSLVDDDDDDNDDVDGQDTEKNVSSEPPPRDFNSLLSSLLSDKSWHGHYSCKPSSTNTGRTDQQSSKSSRSDVAVEKAKMPAHFSKGPFPASSNDSSTNTSHADMQQLSRSTDLTVAIDKILANYSKKPVTCEREPTTNRRSLKDFSIQVRKKTVREIKLQKANKILKQTVARQKHKIKNMSNIIENLLDVYHKSVDSL